MYCILSFKQMPAVMSLAGLFRAEKRYIRQNFLKDHTPLSKTAKHVIFPIFSIRTSSTNFRIKLTLVELEYGSFQLRTSHKHVGDVQITSGSPMHEVCATVSSNWRTQGEEARSIVPSKGIFDRFL